MIALKPRSVNAAAGVYGIKRALPAKAGAAQKSDRTFWRATISDKGWALLLVAGLVLGAGSVKADEPESDDDEDAAEVTIRLMDASESTLPDAVTAEIPVPESLPEAADFGIETANDARSRRETGLSRAESARENAENMAEEARENRENRGRADDNVPDDVPGRPDTPQPPGG